MTKLESRFAWTLASILAVRVRTLFFHAQASVEHGTHYEKIHNQNKELANDTSAIFSRNQNKFPMKSRNTVFLGFHFRVGNNSQWISNSHYSVTQQRVNLNGEFPMPLFISKIDSKPERKSETCQLVGLQINKNKKLKPAQYADEKERVMSDITPTVILPEFGGFATVHAAKNVATHQTFISPYLMAKRLNFASTSLLWPGLPQLWIRGCWLSASIAIGFTILLNLCILTTWIWSEMFSREIFGLLWLSFAAFWVAGCYFNTRFLRKLFYITSEANVPDTFHLAQVEYLKGNWFEAEGLLTKLLERNPGDAEAHLLLVSILKMTDHAEEAIEHLEYMSTLNGSRRWQLEISRELSFLKAVTKQSAKSPVNSELDLPLTFAKAATTSTNPKTIAA